MKKKPDLWNLHIVTTPQLAPALESLWGDEALSVAAFAKPREKKAELDVIFDGEPDLAAIQARLAVASLVHGGKAPKVSLARVGNLNWLKKVAADFPPLKIARWTVYGAAHKKNVKNKSLALSIDATSAFGTGEHPTTRGCLIRLDALLKEEEPLKMLDVGCGSGILSMAFVKGRKAKAIAVDIDPEAVEIAAGNVRRNRLGARLEVGVSNGYKSSLVRSNAPYDLIMANIFADPLAAMAPNLAKALRRGGTAILAGLLTRQAPQVVKAHRQAGLVLKNRLVIGEWTILTFKKPEK